jgi:hypothetical protein
MYFGRLEDSGVIEKKALPNEWLEEFTRTLNDVYHDQLEKNDRFFDVYGEIYEKEFVVIVSYMHKSEQLTSPITLFISHDNLEDSKKFKSSLKDLINLTGIIFDDIFAIDEWNDFNANWTENNFKDSVFHYKITRENISLTIQAEALLNKDIEI